MVNLVLCLNVIGMENGYLARIQLLDAIEGDCDFLLLIRGVGYLDDVTLGVLVETSGCIKAVFALHGLAILCERQYMGSLVESIELLNIIVG